MTPPTRPAPLPLLARFLAALALAGCATAPATRAPRAPAPQLVQEDAPLPIIDAHTHADFNGERERSSGIPMTRAEYFREWREAGVVGAIAHTPSDRGADPDLRAEGVVHCAGASADPAVNEIKAGLRDGRFGCIKIYLGYEHQYASHPRYRKLYRLAEKYDVPVVFHTGDTDSTRARLKYADPLTIDDVAVDYPRVRFVIAHCGNPWIESAAEVAFKNRNVYLECSALMSGNADTTDPARVEEYVVKPIRWIFGYLDDPTKLMFGTDWPLVDIASYARAYRRAIPKEHWPAVFHDNAVRVFKIRGRAAPLRDGR